jgi:hypothetical protein
MNPVKKRLAVQPVAAMTLCLLAGLCVPAFGEDPATVASDYDQIIKQELKDLLPPTVSDGLEFGGWAWVGAMHSDGAGEHNFYDAELSLDITKSFGQRVAATAEANFIDANGERRGELEQGFVSILANEDTTTIVTVGKFNANIGLEARDFWNRTTATTSPLFGAQPQDLVGAMLTQPIGGTGIKARLFVSLDFQGQFYADQPPSGGLTLEYNSPQHALHLQVTNWVGPGFVGYEGMPLRQPYPRGSYGSSGGAGDLIANWQGPNMVAERGGTLYFFDANATWHIRRDLALSGEVLSAKTFNWEDPNSWAGASVLLNFDITDQLGVYGRLSYLDDNDWLTTGAPQRVYEQSCGASYRITDKLELRAEYRHDQSTVSGNVHSVSVHLTFGF